MRLTCPACGADMSLDALIGHEGARQAVVVALQLPAPLGKLLLQYLSLFRPASRQLSMDRVAKLLGDLLGPIQDARITKNGRIWAAPQSAWETALAEIIQRRDNGKLKTPLTSHNYLLEIVAGQSDKTEAVVEKKIEEQKRNPYHRDHSANTGPVATREVTDAAIKALKQKVGKS